MKNKYFLPVTFFLFLALIALTGCPPKCPDTIAGLKNKLRLLEIDSIKNLIIFEGRIDTIDEGWLLSHQYVPQLSLKLQSKACVARMKDITIDVEFISKTQSKIGEKQITIYEFIEPNNSISYKEKITLPDQTARVDFRLLNVAGE